jgi:hypothetical protein
MVAMGEGWLLERKSIVHWCKRLAQQEPGDDACPHWVGEPSGGAIRVRVRRVRVRVRVRLGLGLGLGLGVLKL